MHSIRQAVPCRASSLLALATILVLAAGCPDPGDPSDGGVDGGARDGGTGDGGTGNGGQTTLSGKVTYDFVPATYSPSTRSGTLAFSQSTPRPVRNAVVQVRQGTSILATTNTDEQGNYRLTFNPGTSGGLQVVALARTSNPVIQVEDNTDGNATWAVFGSLTSTSPTMTRDLHAGHGWAGTSYTANQRVAAPFAILDSMYTAARAFMAVRTVNLPDLKVNWSPNNVPQRGDTAAGLIGTSHYSPREREIYILGKDGVDTDEFDSHVIVHEWGHYFEHNLSRADSPGGPHSSGEILDPRLSFGEGYGNALAAMLLPESVYTDTFWRGTGGTLTAFGFDAETEPSPTDDPNPGVFSETSVMRILYDLYDSGLSESHDRVSAGLGTVYDVLVGPQKSTDAMTTIASFVTGLKAQPGVSAAAVDTLLARHGVGPITTPWGNGDTGMRAMYTNVASLPYSGTLTLVGGYDYNKWFQNQYYVFTGNGATVTLSATSAYDVGIEAYRQGQVVGAADQYTSGTESFSFTTQSNATYVLVVTGFKETQGTYSVSISISRP